eukprot:CAMPEP_0206462278 /NCGR_PEP_ID=MMETSP0324_2-20121206/25891_1 /ASSEMBLY_ACC=CAM_ASM_000836 /TAXON_ID=2866 /ORGANISM="Crypthecodinium cohnii, Strain Seligo" /LENGTH=213 /DNA_ID=CAMNT_0053934419 /DNA_START=472 /DNA_END=1114 /DNA_ORIENTATION=+
MVTVKVLLHLDHLPLQRCRRTAPEVRDARLALQDGLPGRGEEVAAAIRGNLLARQTKLRDATLLEADPDFLLFLWLLCRRIAPGALVATVQIFGCRRLSAGDGFVAVFFVAEGCSQGPERQGPHCCMQVRGRSRGGREAFVAAAESEAVLVLAVDRRGWVRVEELRDTTDVMLRYTGEGASRCLWLFGEKIGAELPSMSILSQVLPSTTKGTA